MGVLEAKGSVGPMVRWLSAQPLLIHESQDTQKNNFERKIEMWAKAMLLILGSC